MTKQIELEGMTLEIDFHFDGDNLEIDSVNWISGSYNFLTENIEHSALSCVIVEKFNNWYKENYVDIDQSLLVFYQFSHYDQLEIIHDMLTFDDRFTSEFVEDLRPTRQDCEFELAELRGEAMRELH